MTEFTRLAITTETRDVIAQIADHDGISMSEAVTMLSFARADELDIKRQATPGIHIAPWTADGVPLLAITLNGAETVVFELAEAREFAQQLGQTLIARAECELVTKRGARCVALGFRRGRGVVLQIGDAQRAFTRFAARAIAAEILREAERAEAAASQDNGGWRVVYHPGAVGQPPA